MVKERGNVLEANQYNAYQHFCCVLLLAFSFIVATSSLNHATAQNKEKPKLVPIILDEKTNDDQALAIAKKLDPDFFKIDPQIKTDVKFYARFLPLDKNNAKRFLAVTAEDTMFYCTAHGCPIYLYENHSGNRWRQAQSFLTYAIWYDANTQNSNFANIITQKSTVKDQSVSVFIWNNEYYTEIKR